MVIRPRNRHNGSTSYQRESIVAIDIGLLSLLIALWNKTAVLLDGLLIVFALYFMYKLVLLPSDYRVCQDARSSYNGNVQSIEEFWNAS